MHQRARDADERHFNYVCVNSNEAPGARQRCQRKTCVTPNKTKDNDGLRFDTSSSLSALCCPSEELEEIAYDCSLECSAEWSDYREERSQRHQSDANDCGFFTLPQSFMLIILGGLLSTWYL